LGKKGINELAVVVKLGRFDRFTYKTYRSSAQALSLCNIMKHFHEMLGAYCAALYS
tara:strand:- start:1125 stop:1292 length:168 start_codon:yes stop_codon:yes gene_type:complete